MTLRLGTFFDGGYSTAFDGVTARTPNAIAAWYIL
jgi:hypothetical protein